MIEELLYNHQEICACVFCGNTAQSIKLLQEKLKEVPAIGSIHTKKSYLFSLNYSIYNYILIKENVSLHQCCHKNDLSINYNLTSQNMITIGEEIILSYGDCSEYLIERYHNKHIKKAIYFIHKHLEEPISLEIVCDHININHCYLCDIFKKQVNCTFSQYVTNQRILMAKKLLKNSTLSIEVIAQRCGFSNTSYFSTCFKKVIGVSPCNYRKHVLQCNLL